MLLAGCSSDDITTGGFSISDEWDIKPGDPVAFTLFPSIKAQTREIVKDNSFDFDSYESLNNYEGYELTIEMFGTGAVSKGSAVYSITGGALNPKTLGSQLYWPDNTQAYGFKATAGTETLGTDQSDATNLRNQDRLEGYAFVPLKDGEARQYTEDALNYKTSKEWKTANATFGKTGEDLKKIPLYLKHMRSKITIILNAGANVTSADLASASVTIYSYPGPIAVNKPLHEIVGGFHQYTAIVEPYNYTTETTSGDGGKKIAQITLTTLNKTFTYKPSNDTSGTGAYNLAAGQHLTITITLTASTPTTL